ncbi:MAG TPA: shikimate kinase [Actinotalea sp.]|nr:shikimate kinase [Actinotalea sp.]
MIGTPGPVVVLVGPLGSGKSTTARALAVRLGVTSRDTDEDVERATGRTISDIFVQDGEPTFRALEREAVAAALSAHDGVLALGGGAVLDASTQDALAGYVERGGVVVFLDVSLAYAAPRVGFNQARPLLLGNPRAQWQSLMDARRPVYARVATLRADTDGRKPAQVAAQIAAHLADHAGGHTADHPAESPSPEGPSDA